MRYWSLIRMLNWAGAVSDQRFEAIAGKTAERFEVGDGFQPVQANFRLAQKGLVGWDPAALGAVAGALVSVARGS